MKPILFSIAFAICALCFSQTYQHFYKSSGNGNWNESSSWLYSNDGGSSWIEADDFPGQKEDGTSVLIQCGHTINLPASATYKVDALTIKGVLEFNTDNKDESSVEFTSPLNSFILTFDGGVVLYSRKKCTLKVPANAVITITDNPLCSQISGVGGVGFQVKNCDNGKATLIIGAINYYCQGNKGPKVGDINDNKGTAIGALVGSDPIIVCYYDNETKPNIIAGYMNYDGSRDVKYTLTQVSVPEGSDFEDNPLSKTGTLNRDNPQEEISLNQPLLTPGDYKFNLKVEVPGTSTTNSRDITITKGDYVEFKDGEWEVGEEKKLPTLYNGYSAIIKDNYDTASYGSFDACSCVVEPEGKLTIKDGDSVSLLGNIENKGVSTNVIIEDGGNLIQIYDSVENVGEIEVQKEFTFSPGRKQYNFVSVPVVANKDVKTTIYSPNPTSVQKYNTKTSYFDETNGEYISGIGYAVKESSGGSEFVTGQFVGVPFNGTPTPPYKLNTDGSGYNLVGNPYPSNIDIDKLYQDNKDNIESTFYFWDNRNNQIFIQQGSKYEGVSYATYNALSGTGLPASTAEGDEIRVPNQFVKAGTGFMVQAKTNVLNFNNSQRTTDSSAPSFFGKETGENSGKIKDRYWLTMTTPGGIEITNAVVYFEGGNDSFWKDDSESFLGTDDLFTIVEGNKLAIQGKSAFSNEDVITLGYKAFAEGTHILSVYKQEGVFADGQQIYLVDKLLNKTVNLSEKPYKFVSRAGETNDRFEIIYKPAKPSFSVAAYNVPKNVIDYSKTDNRIQITSSMSRISEVEVFDLNGRPVYKESNIGSKEFGFSLKGLSRQIIIVTVTTEEGEYSTRKFVN